MAILGDTLELFRREFGEYFPRLINRLGEDGDATKAISHGLEALQAGSLSWARLNQILHRFSAAGMSEGCFQYYFLTVPTGHPYSTERVFGSTSYQPPDGAQEILSVDQLKWGVRRFMFDAMLYWGNFRQAYRDLRERSSDEIRSIFQRKRVNAERMIRRGAIQGATKIPRDNRHLISEMACKTLSGSDTPQEVPHVRYALKAFNQLKSEGVQVNPAFLKARTEEICRNDGQKDLFDLMYEDPGGVVSTEDEVVALYAGQWEAFKQARQIALENTRVYLSTCNDLDVYVATSMRNRQDFREMGAMCDRIFGSETLKKYNVRYFDPTLSAATYHEDKGIIECLMVKTAKVLLYFSQHKESLGKVSEYAMALSQGKPVIVLCPDDRRGRELYAFYRDAHPLMRLIESETGIVRGAMVTHKAEDVVTLLDRIFSNKMEYDLARKPGTEAYYLLKERLTQTSITVISDDELLNETFWNNWHGIE